MELPSQRSPLIVVVDDDPWTLRLLADHFELLGLECRCFASAEAFLASNNIEDTGCLVLDVNLPGMNGLELQRHLAATRRSFPIIFHTGHFDPRTEKQARDAGAIDYLEKTAAPAQLIEAITHALASPSS